MNIAILHLHTHYKLYSSLHDNNVIFCDCEPGASKQLAMVVEGESLVNDGAAIVFYNVFVQLATSEKGLTGKQ
jgi:predicted O-methyltransferase YrrM